MDIYWRAIPPTGTDLRLHNRKDLAIEKCAIPRGTRSQAARYRNGGPMLLLRARIAGLHGGLGIVEAQRASKHAPQ